MIGKTTRLILLSALAVAIASCTSSGKDDNVEPNIFPTNYKQEILDTLTHTLVDPTNVRGAFITDPVLSGATKDQRYTACVRYNSRDNKRQYVGSVDHIAYFFGGRLNQLIEATREQCGNAPYKPFPELEALCRAKKCD